LREGLQILQVNAGTFTPGAPRLSKAPQFAKPVPIVGRFSLGGGNP
jgi:catalase